MRKVFTNSPLSYGPLRVVSDMSASGPLRVVCLLVGSHFTTVQVVYLPFLIISGCMHGRSQAVIWWMAVNYIICAEIIVDV